MWGHVQPALAERTRVCAWDRAGYGFSSPSPEPQDIVHTTADLERALKSAGIRGL
jgi:pimeloyl-ACP methyl ester carboxylesterase